MHTQDKVEEIFILMKIGNMTLTEINTLTDQERSMLALRFYEQARQEEEAMKKMSKASR